MNDVLFFPVIMWCIVGLCWSDGWPFCAAPVIQSLAKVGRHDLLLANSPIVNGLRVSLVYGRPCDGLRVSLVYGRPRDGLRDGLRIIVRVRICVNLCIVLRFSLRIGLVKYQICSNFP